MAVPSASKVIDKSDFPPVGMITNVFCLLRILYDLSL
jgi:hypothetical protein